MEQKSLSELKFEIQLQTKKGIDFIISAGTLWLAISLVWTLDYSSYNKSILTFMVGAFLLPLALGFSKIMGTNWKVTNNQLQSLGLWLNFAQLIYFPFLIFILIKYPDYFIMTYAIITGAHLFPYAWFYDEMGYAVCAITISFGVLLMTFNMDQEQVWTIPLFTSAMFFLLGGWIGMRIMKIKLNT
ncbi:DUF7010 family protein [Aquiflexum gelatinilyticum]|uniref:Uncharacterized protein n=1 Tax=Aquiflexum gelatinilyticum TaxID=2961943 RepID=A0A9X2P4E1_9BACT|nr:hypothetical protein [Aquiflexum gelatinilyticum]MCR9015791.1 hypothetical protein [Aquiflexum gelatinilyticum]